MTAIAEAKPRRKTFTPVLVHAYRREPHLNADKKEVEVVVQTQGETIKFHSNAAGHVVGLVHTQAAFDRLTKEIPEAYIEYKAGENIPERAVDAKPEPEGKFVLVNGANKIILDDLADEVLRDFAKSNGITDLHPDLCGEALQQAIYNVFQTA